MQESSLLFLISSLPTSQRWRVGKVSDPQKMRPSIKIWEKSSKWSRTGIQGTRGFCSHFSPKYLSSGLGEDYMRFREYQESKLKKTIKEGWLNLKGLCSFLSLSIERAHVAKHHLIAWWQMRAGGTWSHANWSQDKASPRLWDWQGRGRGRWRWREERRKPYFVSLSKDVLLLIKM